MILEEYKGMKRLTPENGMVLINKDSNNLSTVVYCPLSYTMEHAYANWGETFETSEIVKLSRDKVVEWCKQNNFYIAVMQVLSTDQLAASWFYGTCDFLANSPNALYLQSKLEMSDEQIQLLVEYSRIT